MVPFAKSCLKFNFSGEQFWGRAARAPRSRKRFEALVILSGTLLRWTPDLSCGLRSQVSGFCLRPATQDLGPDPQLVEIVKLTVILASVSTGSLPSR